MCRNIDSIYAYRAQYYEEFQAFTGGSWNISPADKGDYCTSVEAVLYKYTIGVRQQGGCSQIALSIDVGYILVIWL